MATVRGSGAYWSLLFWQILLSMGMGGIFKDGLPKSTGRDC